MQEDKKESIESVEALLSAGKTRREIFRELGGTDDLARIIAFVPSFEARHKHHRMNLALVVVMAYVAFMKIGTAIVTVVSSGMPKYLVLLSLPYALIAIYLAVHIRRFHGWAYLFSGAVCSYIIAMSAQHFFGITHGILFLVNVLLLLPLVVGVALGILLKRALCPDLGFLGAKTASDGSYLFMNREG